MFICSLNTFLFHLTLPSNTTITPTSTISSFFYVTLKIDCEIYLTLFIKLDHIYCKATQLAHSLIHSFFLPQLFGFKTRNLYCEIWIIDSTWYNYVCERRHCWPRAASCIFITLCPKKGYCFNFKKVHLILTRFTVDLNFLHCFTHLKHTICWSADPNLLEQCFIWPHSQEL